MKYSKKILISSCLFGHNVKYDGKNNDITTNSFIQKLIENDLLICVCPEVEGGLETPRVPVEIINSKAINQNGEDKTAYFDKGAKIALELCQKHDIQYAILKFRSPSCGSNQIYDGTFSHTLISGDGICTKLLKKNGVKVFSEKELDKLENLLFVNK
jgi:uncharacterized protein YbbK (DUF523 family)